MTYLKLIWEFFKIGLFSVGGGMATLPFLQRLSETSGWFDTAFITDMVAISESTPGPIGINMATYVGYNVGYGVSGVFGGILGGVAATVGEIIPALIIVTLVARALEKFRSNKLVDNAFYGLRPAVTALIAAAFLSVLNTSFLHYKLIGTEVGWTEIVEPLKLVLFAAMFFAIKKWKKHPVLYIAIAAVLGIVFKF